MKLYIYERYAAVLKSHWMLLEYSIVSAQRNKHDFYLVKALHSDRSNIQEVNRRKRIEEKLKGQIMNNFANAYCTIYFYLPEFSVLTTVKPELDASFHSSQNENGVIAQLHWCLCSSSAVAPGILAVLHKSRVRVQLDGTPAQKHCSYRM